jgi:hypothetical protein
MEPKQHECSAEMRGDAGRVLDALVIALAASGFRVERRTASEVELTGLASFSSHRSALFGVTRIVARASNRRLAITAELGGVERMRRFLLLIPLSLGGVFAILFGVVFPIVFREKRGELGWRVLLPVVPIFVVFLFIGFVVLPLVSRQVEARTRAALDALATSLASIGADG